MNVIGLDIGTTTVSAVVLDWESGAVLASRTVPNGADLPADVPGGSLQDADAIIARVRQILDEFQRDYAPVAAIGIDGQMHGMLYVDADGRAVSPLYTWQDGRGNLPCNNETYISALTRITGQRMSTGFGLATHFWMTVNGKIPADAVKLCTIFDYAAMQLTGSRAPLMHVSGAASLGLFDPETGWMTDAVRAAGMDASFLPEVSFGCSLAGKTGNGVPVSCGIGDNQASFIGSLRDMNGSVLVNIGTGGQVSLAGRLSRPDDDLEMRPIAENRFLVAGSSLCGGRAYALLEGFIRDIARLSGYEGGKLYEAMDAVALEAISLEDGWTFDTRFSGTRSQPGLTACAAGIRFDTFDAKHLIGAVINGIVDELYSYYEKMPDRTGVRTLVGSGNGIRKNAALQRAFERRFGMKMRIPAHNEEAAYGAALYGMTAAGLCGSLDEAQKRIRYQTE